MESVEAIFLGCSIASVRFALDMAWRIAVRGQQGEDDGDDVTYARCSLRRQLE